ncbi:E3 ubiquitin-protein ligase RNF115 [Galdieria sulphuraria]|nr:E3 ubiquitin-protein ligase RNF115 [Galdieria sulphuraria]
MLASEVEGRRADVHLLLTLVRLYKSGVENPLQNEVFVTGGSLLREKALKYLESPPTPKNILDNLVTVHFAQVGGGERCPVCGEEYEQGGPVKKLPCGDIFHLKCIYPWLEFHNTCPLCLEVFIDRER